MRKYWVGAHTKHRLRYHIVWIPKRRKKVLVGEIASRVKALLYEACHMNKWWIEELGVKEDHVHILIQVKPRESVAYVVQKLKGGSSRVLRRENRELEEFVWSDSFWCDGYFAVSVGEVDEGIVKRYIREQSGSSMPS